MPNPRPLTSAERRAVDRVQKALSMVPETLALHFNESGFHVFDREAFEDEDFVGEVSFRERASDYRAIHCRYDCGAL